jgi:ABC-type multidrug transport system fused ATPase/permease subunit
MKREISSPYSVGRVFLRTVRQNVPVSAALFASIAGAVGFALLPPLILGEAVDRLGEGVPVTATEIIGYFACTALAGILGSLREALIAVFGQKMTHGLRSAMSRKLYELPAAYYTSHDPGDLSSRFVNDADTVEELFSSGIISMVSDLASVVSIFVVILTKSVGLAILLAFALPALAILTRSFQRRMLRAQIRNREAVGKAAGHIPQTLQNLRAVRVFHAENFLEEKYDTYLDESFTAMEKSNFYDASYSPIVITVSALIVGMMMTLSGQGGSFRAFFGMSVGTAVAVISYVGKVFDPLESIGMEIQKIQSAIAGIHRIREFMEEPGRRVPGSGEGSAENNATAPAVELQNVSFSYGGSRVILDHCSLTVQEGEHVTVTGRTGRGKTTLLRLILGLYEPEEGSVRVFGRRAVDLPDEEKRRLFGYVEQRFVPVPGTIADQLRLGDHTVTEEEMLRALRIVGLEQEVIRFPEGLNTPCESYVFSQGQWQLLSVARAIVFDPKILLLDEIAAELDAGTEARLEEALRAAAEGRTMISVSHRLHGRAQGRLIRL